MTLSQKLFSFKGRLNRQPFWLCNILVSILVNVLIGVLFKMLGNSALMYSLVLIIPMVWISLALWVKRLHDLDKSGWIVLLMLVPIANLYLLIIAGFFKGTVGPNKFGKDLLNPNMTGEQEKTVEL